MADSILEMLDPEYIAPIPIKANQNKKDTDSSSATFNPSMTQTQSNFCTVSWLGKPELARRDWAREVGIVIEELRDNPNYLNALKSILKHKEAR